MLLGLFFEVNFPIPNTLSLDFAISFYIFISIE